MLGKQLSIQCIVVFKELFLLGQHNIKHVLDFPLYAFFFQSSPFSKSQKSINS